MTMATISSFGPLAAGRKLFGTTLGAAQPSISIPAANIPQNLSALMLMLQGRGDTASISVSVFLRFNGDAGPNYYGEQRYAVGGALSADDLSAQLGLLIGSIAAASAPVGAAGLCVAALPNYAGTTYRKTVHADYGLTNADTTSGHVSGSAYGEWYNSSAVTSLLLYPTVGNFVAGTTCVLYGLA